jgi:hypothetical protein
VLLSAGGAVPPGAIAAGEGGLHYLGAWRVFCRADGGLCLGDQVPADWAALASLVDARLAAIQAKFDAHTHDVATTGSSTAQTGVAKAVAGPIKPLPTVASTKVRCA